MRIRGTSCQNFFKIQDFVIFGRVLSYLQGPQTPSFPHNTTYQAHIQVTTEYNERLLRPLIKDTTHFN